MGEAARHQGDYGRASALLAQSLDLQREIGKKEGVAHALYHLGQVAYDQGNYTSARSYYHESLQIQRDIGNKRGIAALLEAFAALAFAEQQLLQSVSLLGAASALRQSIAAPLSIRERGSYEQLVIDLRTGLGQATFSAAWHTGQHLSTEQAIALAQDSTQLKQLDIEPQQVVRPEQPPAAKQRDLMGLTAREIDVLRLVAQGMTDAEVGEKLVISPRTVNGHLSSIYSKLGVTSRTAAARVAIDKHLI
jgi:DNA-binding CsgD family transcriptional regulator